MMVQRLPEMKKIILYVKLFSSLKISMDGFERIDELFTIIFGISVNKKISTLLESTVLFTHFYS